MAKETKRFKLTADMVFMAVDIDDAFLKLARHFRALERGEESELEIVVGNIEIHRVDGD